VKKLVEVRFKPADVGTVADGAITNIKVATDAEIDQSKIADLPEDLDGKVGTPTGHETDGKKITSIGWDADSDEFVVDHET
jgi:hypothetical protein